MPRSLLLFVIFTASTFLVGACTLHRVEIQQGNVIDAETEVKLKPGMTKEQAQFLFGAPLIIDPFHRDRWDYVYYFDQAGKPLQERRVTLFFQGDKIVRIVKETDLESSLSR